MNKFRTYLSKPWFAYTFAACSAVLLYALLWHLPSVAHAVKATFSFLSPIIIGAVTAYLFCPVSDFFERRVFRKIKSGSARHSLSVVITLVCVILILVLLLVALIPSLVQSVNKLVENRDVYMEKINSLFIKIESFAQDKGINISVESLYSLLEDALDKLVDYVKNNTNIILKTAGSIGTVISNIVIGLVFGFCFLAAKNTIVGILFKVRYAFVKKETAQRNDYIWKSCHEIFLRYVGCTLFDALIIGVSTLIFMLVFRLPYAPLIAVIVAITNIIPTVGPVIGGAFGVFFLILDRPINALWFLIFTCVIQVIDAFIIKPKLFKGSLGIPGVWTLVLIILGSKVAGLLGVILAIPFAAIGVIIYDNVIVPKLEKKTEIINKKEE